jgi:signal transduction histidine kinase
MLFSLVLRTLGALVLSLAIIIIALSPPMQDIQLLFLFMSSTGCITIGTVYFLYRRGAMQWFRSLRWTLLAITVLTVLLVFVNVFVTAQLMFISRHDLVLTTALLVFAALVSVISVFFISNTLIDRIHKLVKATQRLAKGDFKTRLEVDGNDEIAELTQTFNTMARALQEVDEQKRLLEQAKRDLIAWVSHDLRTPLAAVRVMNEAMIDGVVTDPETVSRYRQNIQNEIQHLSHLIDDLFELAQLDTGHITLKCEMTSLHDLISDALGSLHVRAEQQSITLTGNVSNQIGLVSIAPDKIQRVLHNLLENALHHTPAGGKIMLTAQKCEREILISVHNTGSYIADTDLPHIFKSFYRGERSRAQASNGYRGTGLGLAIARGFVEAHGGKLWVESQIDKGTTFMFTVPTL